MALTCAELIDEVQSLVGATATAEPLIDTTRCTRWLNEAQVSIAEECPGIRSLVFSNSTSLDTTQTLRYSIAEITVGDVSTQRPSIIERVYYLDGNESTELTWIHMDEFDTKYPDPTHSDIAKDKPTHWTRRGGNIEIFPLCQTSNCDNNLRFDGYYYPREFSTDCTRVSDVTNGDKGLIYYGCWQAQEAIGANDESLKWQARYTDWLNQYKDYQQTDFGWSGNMFDDELM